MAGTKQTATGSSLFPASSIYAVAALTHITIVAVVPASLSVWPPWRPDDRQHDASETVLFMATFLWMADGAAQSDLAKRLGH